MAFKMKNPSMAKLTKAAGNNRAAMKMKMEDKAAAKMKKESAMKMKSPMKADIPEVTITDKKKPEAMKAFSHYTYGGKKVDVVEGDKGVKFIKVGNKLAPLNRELKKGNLKYRDTDGNDISYRYKTEESRARQARVDQYYSDKEREGGAATKMKKSAMKLDKKEIARRDRENPNQKPGKGLKKSPKMNMVKGPDGKMVPDFAVDGKGAGDMKSGAKMKKPKAKMKKAKLPTIAKPVKQTTKKPKEPRFQAKF